MSAHNPRQGSQGSAQPWLSRNSQHPNAPPQLEHEELLLLELLEMGGDAEPPTTKPQTTHSPTLPCLPQTFCCASRTLVTSREAPKAGQVFMEKDFFLSLEPLPPSAQREVPALHSHQQLINPQGSKTVPHIPKGSHPLFSQPLGKQLQQKNHQMDQGRRRRLPGSPPETPFLLPSGGLGTLIPPDNLGTDQGSQHSCSQQPQTKTSLRTLRNTSSTSKNPAQSAQTTSAEGERQSEAGARGGFA